VKINISYNKGKVLQALRYHFFSRREIKLMMILVNVFALLAGVLYGLKLIQPLPFLMSSVLWLSMMVAYWIWLPALIYRKSKTFKDNFEVTISPQHIFLFKRPMVPKAGPGGNLAVIMKRPDSSTFILITKVFF